ncbi:Na-translocating system protein MpsC family protein [Paenibacillus dauci]|uniref:Na-translocating system protein MpsC family protein n=1 Tax=Paenibacillus dauci TaxID=1567106 RepID=UPI00061990E4|nr:Na-translocating system protein MpsC family protein [Paenibacillus dauci]
MSQQLHLDPILRQANLLCQSQFGKQPERIHIHFNQQSAVILLQELTDSGDERLPDDPDERYTHIHILLSQFVFPALQKKIEYTFGHHVSHVFIDWKLEYNTAAIAVTFETLTETFDEDIYTGKADLHIKVSQITESVQKAPEAVNSFWLSNDILVVLRKGLLINLEKQIIQKGFNSALRVSKRELELGHFLEELPILDLLGRPLRTAYLDWDFEQDFSMLLLILEK